MPNVVEEEAVRIFVEFDRIDSAIKGSLFGLKPGFLINNETVKHSTCTSSDFTVCIKKIQQTYFDCTSLPVRDDTKKVVHTCFRLFPVPCEAHKHVLFTVIELHYRILKICPFDEQMHIYVIVEPAV